MENSQFGVGAAGLLQRPLRRQGDVRPQDAVVLLGNPEAGPPSYELGLLAREVLAYSAVPLDLGEVRPPDANPAHQRGVADAIREAPPTLVLWGALGFAVVVLLALTRRILKRAA